MSLKNELQSISSDEVSRAEAGVAFRLRDLDPAELEREGETYVEDYLPLHFLATFIQLRSVEEGCTDEQAVERGVGAASALLVITTIAESRELPPLD